MTIKINGDNSVANPGFSGDDTDTGLQVGTNELKLVTGGTEAVTVDSSQNVGIGTATPGAPLEIKTPADTDAAIRLNEGTTTNPLQIEQSSTEARIQILASQPLVLAGQSGSGSTSFIKFETRGNERARIDSSGNFFTGGTNSISAIEGGTQAGKVFKTDHTASSGATSTSQAFHLSFANPNGFVGSISTSGSATAFNTSSDHRLKENVVDLTGAIDRVNQLQVRRFNFIADPDTTVDGFIAHEAQAVVPEAVTGTQDEVDDDNNPVYQGIDQSKLVPLLTAALQEAIAKIETLETQNADLLTRVTALENV